MDENGPSPSWPARLLVDLAEDRLAPDEIEMVELLLRAEGLTQPPPWIQRRAERIAGQRHPPRRRPLDVETPPVRRVVASLAFDSQVQPQFVGLRASQTRVRRLLFQAENIEVDLEMVPAPSRSAVRLAGQVTAGGADPRGGYLRLSTGTSVRLAELDESGEFALDSLTPGAYRLEVVVGDRLVEVPILPI